MSKLAGFPFCHLLTAEAFVHRHTAKTSWPTVKNGPRDEAMSIFHTYRGADPMSGGGWGGTIHGGGISCFSETEGEIRNAPPPPPMHYIYLHYIYNIIYI